MRITHRIAVIYPYFDANHSTCRSLLHKPAVMSEPQKKVYLDLSNLDVEFNRTLELIVADDEEKEDMPTSSTEVNFYLQSPALAHEAMADVFVNYDVNENKRGTERLIKKLCEEDKREEQKLKQEEERGKRAQFVETAYEIFEGRYTRPQIRQFLKDHNYDIDKAIDEMSIASTIGLCKKGPVYAPKTVFASNERIIFSSSPRNSPPASPRHEREPNSINEAIKIANECAVELQKRSKHHAERAHHYGSRDARFGPLMAIARDEQQKADKIQDEADALQATKIGEKLDLHGLPVRRGLCFVSNVVQMIREKRPYQTKLEIVTGRGNNSFGGRAIMKEAVIEFLRKMNIKFEVPAENSGVVMVFPHRTA